MSSTIVMKHKKNGSELRFKESTLMVHQDKKVDLAGGEEFLRAFINEEMLSKSGTGDVFNT